MHEESTRVCSRCAQTKPTTDFHRRSDRPNGDGFKSPCKTCRAARYAQNREKAAAQWASWYARNQQARAASEAERARSWRNSHPAERYLLDRARDTVRKAIKRGILRRPEVCEQCGQTRRIQAAHWSYEPERWLDVRWLCRPCHARWDAAEPKLFR